MTITAIKNGISYYGNITRIANIIGSTSTKLQRWNRERKWDIKGESIPIFENGYLIYFDTKKV